MALCIIEVCQPTNAFYPDEAFAVLVNPASCRIQWIMIRHPELAIATVDAYAQPKAVFHHKRENLFCRQGIDIANDEELLLVSHQLRKIFPEEGKRRIGDDDVGLPEEFDAFGRAEVSVAAQFADADFFGVRNPVAVLVAVIDEVYGTLAVVPGKQIDVLVLVAGGDESFEPEGLELVGEIMEEVGNARIVAVAENGLAPEVVAVVSDFFRDVGELRVELVLFRRLGGRQRMGAHVVFLSFPARRRGRKRACPFPWSHSQSVAPERARKRLWRKRKGRAQRARLCQLEVRFRKRFSGFPIERRVAQCAVGYSDGQS